MACGVVERHLGMAQPTKNTFLLLCGSSTTVIGKFYLQSTVLSLYRKDENKEKVTRNGPLKTFLLFETKGIGVSQRELAKKVDCCFSGRTPKHKFTERQVSFEETSKETTKRQTDDKTCHFCIRLAS